MQCPMCYGRGYHWIGLIDDAYREECELCGGKGHGHLQWHPLFTVLFITLILWTVGIALLLWV